jgi:hypothetical protein
LNGFAWRKLVLYNKLPNIVSREREKNDEKGLVAKRERDKQRERETNKERERETNKKRERQTKRETEKK